jgi:membrane protein DedA with SNARE-associated domain
MFVRLQADLALGAWERGPLSTKHWPVLAFLSSTSTIASGGLLIIFLLQVAQSCCIPTSSELTLAFAGVLAYQGHLNLVEVIAVGVAGELVGAVIAWVIGKTGGRAFVTRYGRFVLLTRTDLDRAEAWYGRHRRGGVFIGRCIPVIRNFVALVAGVAEVPIAPFVIFTFLGSLIWDAAWASIGYGLGSKYKELSKGFTDAGYIIAVLVIIAIVFVFTHRWRTYKHLRATEDRDAALADAAGGGTGSSAGDRHLSGDRPVAAERPTSTSRPHQPQHRKR